MAIFVSEVVSRSSSSKNAGMSRQNDCQFLTKQWIHGDDANCDNLAAFRLSELSRAALWITEHVEIVIRSHLIILGHLEGI
jgi:hypothetical protein